MKEAFEKIKDFLKSKFDYCAEQAGMNLDAECGSEIASYFRERKELYLDRANIYGEVMREIEKVEAEYGNGREKQTYEICLNGCDDDTTFKMDLTESEYQFLLRVSDLANKTSYYGCMPRMYVEPYKQEEGEQA